MGAPTQEWFRETLGPPTAVQEAAWSSIRSGSHTLVAAPTGSGKTLAAFLVLIDDLFACAAQGALPDEIRVVYVSPLRALSNDIEQNLRRPLEGILARMPEGVGKGAVRAAVRTGDTPSKARQALTKRAPHILVTTPESLYLLLTSESGRRSLAHVQNVIVDEIHALVGDRRGSHLSLSLERLERVRGGPIQRIGLSATQRPVERVAHFLVGNRRDDSGAVPCRIIDYGQSRPMDLEVVLPSTPLSHVMSQDGFLDVQKRVASLVQSHQCTLIFVNTRRLAERLTAALEPLLGADAVASHHGSLSRAHRERVESALRERKLRALVATASMELGIDVGEIDLVIQIGCTRSIASFVQRVGRSGHRLSGMPKGRLFPLSLGELAETEALLLAIKSGTLDEVRVPERPLDILAQQIVAEVSAGPIEREELRELYCRAMPYADLPAETFAAVVGMLGTGFSTARGRRGALLHVDGVHGVLRPRRASRLVALTAGGAIADLFDYDVVLESSMARVGSVHEDFAIESMAGDVFRLGATSWQIAKIESGRVLVRPAPAASPAFPFWLGEAPARSAELSRVLSERRAERDAQYVIDDVRTPHDGAVEDHSRPFQSLDAYLYASWLALGVLPRSDYLVLERFFDDAGGMQLIVHAPVGARINRALGLALRKRFCRKFNFELQAAATDDAVLLSLSSIHSFPLAEVWGYLTPESVPDVLTQALLDSPLFVTRFRWNANRSLAVPRSRAGSRVPAILQRMQTEDLLASVFPDQLACFENLAGRREVPDHPLVEQTLVDCREEAMDLPGLVQLLEGIRSGRVRTREVDLHEPSPLARAILNSAPYTFLDDAPLEERRARAVRSRHHLSDEDARQLGRLDPAVVEETVREVWPAIRDAEELHDTLLVAKALPPDRPVPFGVGSIGLAYAEHARALEESGRLQVISTHDGQTVWVATEHRGELEPAWSDEPTEASVRELLRGAMMLLGPSTPSSLVAWLHLPEETIDWGLRCLEAEGAILRVGERAGPARSLEDAGELWCERDLLARISRRTLAGLHKRVAPASPDQYVHFLTNWQHVAMEARVTGPLGLARVLQQLSGFAAPLSAWERDILPARVDDYEPHMLDHLCLTGQFAWVSVPSGSAATPLSLSPIAFLPRADLAHFLPREPLPRELDTHAERIHRLLEARGAMFPSDMARAASMLPSEVESALARLVVLGLVHADGVSALGALRPKTSGRRTSHEPRAGTARFSCLPPHEPGDDFFWPRVLLRRWGILSFRMTKEEPLAPPWHVLVRPLRRMEQRGEVLGGRFVEALSGEQFALPEAVPELRAMGSAAPSPPVSLSTFDPLNLSSSLFGGARVARIPRRRFILEGGRLVAFHDGTGKVFAEEVTASRRAELAAMLDRVRQNRPTRTRALPWQRKPPAASEPTP